MEIILHLHSWKRWKFTKNVLGLSLWSGFTNWSLFISQYFMLIESFFHVKITIFMLIGYTCFWRFKNCTFLGSIFVCQGNLTMSKENFFTIVIIFIIIPIFINNTSAMNFNARVLAWTILLVLEFEVVLRDLYVSFPSR